MANKIAAWFGIIIGAILLVSIGNDLLTYHIEREAGVNFGEYHEYSGVIHVHTTYSDGSGTYQEIGEICDSLGLHFAIITDHNTVQPMKDSLARRFGMTLIIPAVEISTDGEHGHFLVIGDSIPLVPRNGISSDSVFNDAVRKGDMTILAHIYHPRKTLKWDNWNIGKFTGIELYNFDEAWRSNLNFFKINKLIAAVIVYIFQGQALNYILEYPAAEMKKFDQLNLSRKVVGIGSLDAHANVKIGRAVYHFPRYVSLFNLLHTIIVTRTPFNGLYQHDRELTLKAIKNGNCFVAFTGIENARGFLFTAFSDTSRAIMGDSLKLTTAATLSVSIPDSDNVIAYIFKDGAIVKRVDNRGSIQLHTESPGAYRVVVFQTRIMLPFFVKRKFPWIISNPIYLYK
ncbi:MAG: PHP domain-containing protein [Candidatus Kryptoniota bacterium]